MDSTPTSNKQAYNYGTVSVFYRILLYTASVYDILVNKLTTLHIWINGMLQHLLSKTCILVLCASCTMYTYTEFYIMVY